MKGVKEVVGEGASVNLVKGPVGVEGMWMEGEEGGETGMFFCFFFLVLGFFGGKFLGWGVMVDVGLKRKIGWRRLLCELIDRSC